MKSNTGNIILIGFMGVGKGRTARMLAGKSGLFAVDTDQLIESLTKKKIRDIFAEQGEASFRELERHAATWIEKNVRNTIVAAGGGFFAVPNIRELGAIVYLHSPVEAILKAIRKHPDARKKIKKRPLLQDSRRAKALFAERLPRYREVADFEIDVQGQDTEQVVAAILARL